MLEQLSSMNYSMLDDEDKLVDADLKTMLIIIGGYLHAGADIEEIEDETYDRLLTLLIKHINIRSEARDVSRHNFCDILLLALIEKLLMCSFAWIILCREPVLWLKRMKVLIFKVQVMCR